MKKNSLIWIVVVFISYLVLAQCSNNDGSSDDEIAVSYCQDPLAKNYLQEGECQYDSDGGETGEDTHELVIYLDSSSSELSGFAGETISEKIIVLGENGLEENLNYVVSGINGIVVDAEGNLSYSVPLSSTNVLQNFQILVTNISGKTGLFEGKIYAMQKDILASGNIGTSGGTVSNSSGSITLSIDSGVLGANANITINKGCDALGNPEINIKGDVVIDRNFSVSLLTPEALAQELNCASSSQSSSQIFSSSSSFSTSSSDTEDECEKNKWGIFQNVWKCDKKYFSKVRHFRVDHFPADETAVKNTCESIFDLLCLNIKPGAALFSSSSMEDDLSGKEPVLFIHGFVQGDKLGGGEDSWNLFPQLLEEQGDYLAFEFKWRSNARFEDVAEDLASALQIIHEKTSKKVHIIAHSFGGILVRTVLQKLNVTDGTGHVASLITFGTPHSGIFDEATQRNAINFPDGQDSFMHGFCHQISCYQMGEYVAFTSSLKSLLGLDSEEGKIAIELADVTTNSLPENIPIRIVIGLVQGREGDGLISYAGQRAHPIFVGSDLIKKAEFEGTTFDIREVKLEGSFKHSSRILIGILNLPREVYVDSVNHKSLQLTLNWLSRNRSPFSLSGTWTGNYSWDCDGRTGSSPLTVVLSQIDYNSELSGTLSYLGDSVSINYGHRVVNPEYGTFGMTSYDLDFRGDYVYISHNGSINFVNNEFYGRIKGNRITGTTLNGDSFGGCSAAYKTSGTFELSR